MFKKIILLLLIISLSGCTFAWRKRASGELGQAKAKIYGEAKDAKIFYESLWYLRFGWGNARAVPKI